MTSRHRGGSASAFTWAKETTFDVDGVSRLAAKAIMLLLADYVDERWSTYVSQDRIAEEAEVSSRLVRSYLAAAETDGILCREQTRNPGGRGRGPDRIFLHVRGDRGACPCDVSPADPAVETDVSPADQPAGCDTFDDDARPSIGTQEPRNEVSDVSDAERLCDLLADLIEANGSKRPNVTATWITEIDRMIRLDERPPDLIEKAIRWSQGHPFWASNIMSPQKLRKQFDTLRLQSINEKRRSTTTQPAAMGGLLELAREEHVG